jgi:hypothetical protein
LWHILFDYTSSRSFISITLEYLIQKYGNGRFLPETSSTSYPTPAALDNLYFTSYASTALISALGTEVMYDSPLKILDAKGLAGELDTSGRIVLTKLRETTWVKLGKRTKFVSRREFPER